MRTLLLIAFVCFTYFSFAQEAITGNITETSTEPKKLSLNFRLDYGINLPLFLDTRELYKGEFLDILNNQEWIWKDEEKIVIQDSFELKQTNIKFDLLLSTFKNLNVGLSYKLMYNQAFVPIWDRVYSYYEDYIFFSICGTLDYEYELPFVKNLYINPSASIGFYQWMSYDQFAYRKNNPSEIFTDRNRVEKIDFKYVNYGVGLSYRFFIYPD